jgi:hypothetical protein
MERCFFADRSVAPAAGFPFSVLLRPPPRPAFSRCLSPCLGPPAGPRCCICINRQMCCCSAASMPTSSTVSAPSCACAPSILAPSPVSPAIGLVIAACPACAAPPLVSLDVLTACRLLGGLAALSGTSASGAGLHVSARLRRSSGVLPGAANVRERALACPLPS